MFPALQPQEIQPTGGTSRSTDNAVSWTPAPTPPSLLALGADLKAYFEQPDQATFGDFAVLVERLHGEFKMICGDAVLLSAQEDQFADLFADTPTRELSPSEIGQIESVLREL